LFSNRLHMVYCVMLSPLEFSIELVRHAGDLLSEFFVPFGIAATEKSDHSLVTQADLAADRLISDTIRSQYPEDLILSEESNTRSGNLERPTWIIDPLDGTTNFSLGLPIWGVSIARIVDSLPQTGVAYFPMVNELYTAEAGQGAALNEIRLNAGPRLHEHKSFFSCCTRTIRHYKVDLPYKTRILGSAAYGICSVARQAAIMGMEMTPKIWDLAAVWLIIQEAGCEISVLEGDSPFPLESDFEYQQKSFPTIAARDEKSLSRLRQAVAEKPR
jgi:myo-inositol-1(or 4)-monophosphatase